MLTLRHTHSKSAHNIISDLLAQTIKQQQKNQGTTHAGVVLQHLVWAKLALLSPRDIEIHHRFPDADAESDCSGELVIGDTIIHCTAEPTEALLKKCKANLQSGKHPIILTLAKMIGATEKIAETLGIEERIEIMDVLQFLAANLYKMSLFNAGQRKIAIEKLAKKYNEIISEHESDASLRINLG